MGIRERPARRGQAQGRAQGTYLFFFFFPSCRGDRSKEAVELQFAQTFPPIQATAVVVPGCAIYVSSFFDSGATLARLQTNSPLLKAPLDPTSISLAPQICLIRAASSQEPQSTHYSNPLVSFLPKIVTKTPTHLLASYPRLLWSLDFSECYMTSFLSTRAPTTLCLSFILIFVLSCLLHKSPHYYYYPVPCIRHIETCTKAAANWRSYCRSRTWPIYRYRSTSTASKLPTVYQLLDHNYLVSSFGANSKHWTLNLHPVFHISNLQTNLDKVTTSYHHHPAR